ncbi:MAG TPA: phage tail protein [Ilumatobacteraceae bacterium]
MTIDHDIEMQQGFFAIAIDGQDEGYFTEVSGIGIDIDVSEQAQIMKDGNTKVTVKVPASAKYTEITLKRGFTTSAKFQSWFDEVVNAKSATPYKTASITVYNRVGEKTATFNFDKVWPSKLSISDLSASSGELIVEEVTLQHDELEWK